MINEKTISTGSYFALMIDEKTGAKKYFSSKNFRPDSYRRHLANQASGSSIPASLEMNYVSITTKDITLSKSDGDLSSSSPLELARVAVGSVTENDFYSTWTTTIPSGIGTTASSGISSVTSQTEFTLNDASNFRVGDRILVPGQFVERRITAKSGNDITINSPFSGIVTDDDNLIQLITQVMLVYNGTASLNTGFASSIASLIAKKSANEKLIITHKLEYL